MEKVLYATDELTGLIGACAIMRPSKSIMDLEVKSVRKKSRLRSLQQAVQERSLGLEQNCLVGS